MSDHDPLCRRAKIMESLMEACPECALIARVREDTACKCKFWSGYAAGVKAARDAVDGTLDVPHRSVEYVERYRRIGEAMSDVQRWDMFAEVGINEPVKYDMWEAVEGRYVTYADHVAAVAAARTEEVLNRDSVWGDGYSQAMHDAFGDMSMEEFVAAAEQRVRDELPPNGADALWYLLGQRKGVKAARDAVAAQSRVSHGGPHTYLCISAPATLAAIDALRTEKS